MACDMCAQLPSFRNYGIKEGLPSSETYCILQDSRGYVFIGTDRGLARFDGTNFETFTTEDGLVDNTVFMLSEDHNKLWYYTFPAKLGYLSGDSLLPYRYNDEIRKLATSSLWTSIFFDKDGTLLLNKLTGFENSKYSIHGVRRDGKTSILFGAPQNENQRNVYIKHNGRCFTTGSLHAGNVVVLTQNCTSLCTLRVHGKSFVNDFAYTMQGHVWLCINSNVYVITGGSCKKIIALDKAKELLYMFVDDKENVWIGYREKGLFLYRRNDHYKRPVQMLPSFSVSCIMKDREQGMWFTTLENGVYYLPPEFLFSIDEKSKLGTVKTVKVLRYHNKPLLLQSDNTLLSAGKDDSWAPVFPGKRIFSAMVSAEDKMYFSSTMNWQIPKNRDSFIRVFSIRLLYTGDTIFTGAGSRIICFDKKGSHLKEDTFLQVSRFTCMAQARSNTYIIGTLLGLFIYKGGSLEKMNDGLSCRISAIEVLDNKHMAVATYGSGILIMDRDNYKITSRITKADGLRGIAMSTLYKENDTVLWVGTNRGLGRILYPADKRKMTVYWSDMDDGLLSNEINDMCRIDSQLWLATARGISLFPINKQLVYEDSIPIRVKSIRVNGSIRRDTNMTLAYGQNNISISFIGLSYHYGPALRYCYRLKGNDDARWNYTYTPTVNYSSLSPGSYAFEYGVLAPNQKAIRHTASLSFTILSPFWLRWWFIACMAIVVVLLLYAVIYGRVRAVQKRMQIVTDLNMYRDKALRNQMSPHFIYNSLNLVGNFVIKQDAPTSMSILSKFSKLLRLTFKNTGEELITVEKDLEALMLYIEMESMRFPERFKAELPLVLPEILKQSHIPPLLFQPFVENAILHGLLPKKQAGLLSLVIKREGDAIHVVIKDNGIGRVAAAEIKKRKDLHRMGDPAEDRKDSGITVTIARIKQVWGRAPDKARFKIVDLYDSGGVASGTIVEFYLPFIP